MKKIIMLLALLVLLGLPGFAQTAQTGINTISPQQALQISGTPSTTVATGIAGKALVTPTIRIDGLNQTNNMAHPASGNSVLPVYATSNGDLVTASNKTQLIIQTLPGIDAIPTAIPLTVSGTAVNTVVLKTISFTLARPSLVHFSSMISIANVATSSTNAIITDGRARMMGLQFQFTASATSGIPLNTPFASDTDTYTNSSAPGGSTIPTGYYFYNLGKTLKLAAGAYTFQILGCAASNNNPLYLTFGLSTAPADSINITALAL